MKPSEAHKHIIDDIKEKIEGEFNYAYEMGKAEGLKEGIATQVKTISIQKGDILIFKNSDASRHTLDAVRRSLQPEGLLAVLAVKEHADIGKLSDVNLGLVGLVKKANYQKCVDWIRDEACLGLEYQQYMHSDGENTIDGARRLLEDLGE